MFRLTLLVPGIVETIVEGRQASDVALALLIAVHEYGHYRVAVACGVKVLRFSVGFGKTLLRWQPKGSPTEFVIAMFPLGGYVRMLDEREAPVPPHERHLAFNNQSLAVRSAIVAAGPLVNLLLAVDETRYVIAPPDPGFPPCTAVYVAGLEPYKRHELAVGIDGLRLLYWRPSAGNLFRTRNLLPHADFTNHRFGGGPHALVTGARYCSAVQSARVGLGRSEVDGVLLAFIPA